MLKASWASPLSDLFAAFQNDSLRERWTEPTAHCLESITKHRYGSQYRSQRLVYSDTREHAQISRSGTSRRDTEPPRRDRVSGTRKRGQPRPWELASRLWRGRAREKETERERARERESERERERERETSSVTHIGRERPARWYNGVACGSQRSARRRSLWMEELLREQQP